MYSSVSDNKTHSFTPYTHLICVLTSIIITWKHTALVTPCTIHIVCMRINYWTIVWNKTCMSWAEREMWSRTHNTPIQFDSIHSELSAYAMQTCKEISVKHWMRELNRFSYEINAQSKGTIGNKCIKNTFAEHKATQIRFWSYKILCIRS